MPFPSRAQLSPLFWWVDFRRAGWGLLLGALMFCSREAHGQGVLLTEFMAENDAGLTDADGAHPDWIELHNPTANAVNMAGWYLTDTSTNLTRWRFPDVTIAPNSFLLVFASGKNRAGVGPGAELHTNFELEQAGGYLALVRPD